MDMTPATTSNSTSVTPVDCGRFRILKGLTAESRNSYSTCKDVLQHVILLHAFTTDIINGFVPLTKAILAIFTSLTLNRAFIGTCFFLARIRWTGANNFN
jgi:hypothetical protein